MYRFIQKTVLAVVAAFTAGCLSSSAYVPVSVESSDLPVKAKSFIKKHFDGKTIVKFEKKFWSNSYELELSDGTDIDFDSKGKCTEVSAPDHGVLSTVLVRELLPAGACKTLSDQGMLESVEEIQINPTKGYKVEVRHERIDDYRFNNAGQMTRVTHDD